MTEWDFDRQQSETNDTLADLATNQGVAVGPQTIITLDIFLMPTEAAEQDAMERALAMFGYAGELDSSSDDGDSFVVTIPDVALTAEDVWLHEERVSKIAVARGFTPDGWGFYEPE